jgi:superfamily II DNA or RNA helicase
MEVASYIEIKPDELSRAEWDRLFKALRYGDNNGRIYEPWRYVPEKGAFRLPRGAWNHLPDHIVYDDRRVCPVAPAMDFKVELDAELEDGRKFEGQKAALKSMFTQEQGLIVAQPGFGKTQVALAFVARCETRTLVLVHTEDILNQWVDYARMAIPGIPIGIIRQDEAHVGLLTVATVQTFHKRLRQQPDKWRKAFGAVILDEAHHAAAKTFEQTINLMPARYRFGFTATTARADGKQPYTQLVIGPIIHKQKFQSRVKVEVERLRTRFYYGMRGPWDWSTLVDNLISDDARNWQIAERISREVEAGHSTLVLSRRIEHLERMGLLLGERGIGHEILTGKRNSKDRKRIIEDFRSGKLKLLLATQLADEALDVPILSRVVLTFPGKHDGRIVQQVGRALREFPDKDDSLIIDVVDDKVRVLGRQAKARESAYRSMKIPIRKEKFQWR